MILQEQEKIKDIYLQMLLLIMIEKYKKKLF